MASAREETKKKIDKIHERKAYLERLMKFTQKALDILEQELVEEQRVYALLGGVDDTTTVPIDGN